MRMIKCGWKIANDTMQMKLQPWTYCLGNFPRAPVQCWRYQRNQCTQIFTPTLKRGEGGVFSNIWDQDCSSLKNVTLSTNCWKETWYHLTILPHTDLLVFFDTNCNTLQFEMARLLISLRNEINRLKMRPGAMCFSVTEEGRPYLTKYSKICTYTV